MRAAWLLLSLGESDIPGILHNGTRNAYVMISGLIGGSKICFASTC
jgi:hypothetical protein